MRIPTALLSLCAFVFVFVSGAGPASAQDDTLHYQAQVLRTSYGIPHVKAQDWGSLGYGYGYAFAQDNICVLAQDLLIATGTLSRFYGPGDAPDYRRLASDSVYKMVNSDARVSAAWASLDADMRDVMNGYAAGYNRYLRDTGVGGLSAACRDQPWVRPITGIDLLKVMRRFVVGTSTGLFVKALFSAAPPGPGDTAIQAPDAADAARLLEAADLPDFSPEGFGSNGVALGSELTGGTGGLLGNPHFPWYGITRFYGVHLTIPGRYDVMGASVYGFPLVNIGFNRSLAWSHTVSTGRRFVFRELTLSKIDPTAYVYDGRTLPMTTEVVSVDVLQDDDTIQTVDHTFYMTRFGAVLVIPPILKWTHTTAYALTDVNLDNSRTFAEFREMGRARTIDEFSQVLRKYVGLPWVNTVAADSKGNAFYADMTVVPHVTNAQLADEDCKGSPITEPLAALRMFTLNGSRPKCDPGTDADAPVAGIFGPGNLPSLVRRDYVQNSNMSYWLTNPDAPLEGYSRLIGDDENRPQNFRTRLGITQIRDRMAGADGLPGTGFDRQWMQDVLFENRHYSAEIMLDDVLTLCATEDPIVFVDGTPVNVTEACDVLAAWDRRNKTASVGPHVWTEFWKRAMTPPSTGLYEVPFDPADPVNTPRGAKLSDPLVRARLMHDLGATVKYFADNLIPLDREWGAVQFDIRNGEPIPIHGGSVASGVYNGIITSPLIKGLGYTQVLLGSSYIQAVTWTPRGPDARALVTYSQSTDPENPHYADQTKLFSGYGWVDMPFAEGDIRRDPNLTSMQLREKR